MSLFSKPLHVSYVVVHRRHQDDEREKKVEKVERKEEEEEELVAVVRKVTERVRVRRAGKWREQSKIVSKTFYIPRKDVSDTDVIQETSAMIKDDLIPDIEKECKVDRGVLTKIEELSKRREQQLQMKDDDTTGEGVEDDDTVAISQDQREHMLYVLETSKQRVQKKLKHVKQGSSEEQKLLMSLRETRRLISSVKKCDIWDKIYTDRTRTKALVKEFLNKYKGMTKDDFLKIVDLTAPKHKRKPEESLQIMKKHKMRGKKHHTTKRATKEERKKIKKQFAARLRKFDDDMLKELTNSYDENVFVYKVRQENPDAFGHKKTDRYDPSNFKGMLDISLETQKNRQRMRDTTTTTMQQQQQQQQEQLMLQQQRQQQMIQQQMMMQRQQQMMQQQQQQQMMLQRQRLSRQRQRHGGGGGGLF